MNVEQVRALCSQTHGLIELDDELALLHRLASALQPGQVYFEIGTAGGRSALTAALSAQEGVEIWTIDIGGRKEDVRAHVKYIKRVYERFARYDVLHKVRFCPLASAEMPWDDKPINVLFIDGGHSPAAVGADVERWTPFVPVGGVVAFHDAVKGPWAYYKGALAAVKRLLDTGDWTQEQSARSIAVLKRIK